MKRLLPVILGIAVIGILFITLHHSNSPATGKNYADSIREGRIEKDDYMRKDVNSPFVARHEEFHGLKYFRIDKSFRVKAGVVPLPGQEVIRMPMSDGTSEAYLKYATVNFYLDGRPQHLVMYKSADNAGSTDCFIPFYDETSANTTYGGGRFLEVYYKSGPEVILDFNLAYNPYCAYVEGYACPVPPAENRVTVKVEAGEKKYKD